MTTSAAKFIHDERGIQTFGKAPGRALARLYADFRLFFAHGAKWHGDGVLRTCQQRIQSVLFARYSAQELAAASESLLFGTVGDIDRRIRAIGLRADGVETSQQEPHQLPQKQCLPGKPASTPRSRHGNAYADLAQRDLIRLWRKSSKHTQEPWLTMITTSGAGSSSSRMVAAMANSERLRLMS
jgi:hypothetical protein